MEPWAAHLLDRLPGALRRHHRRRVDGPLPAEEPAAEERPTRRPASPRRRRRPLPPLGPIASKTKGLRKIDGFIPLYWDEPQGEALDGDLAVRQGILVSDRAGERAGVEPGRARPRAARRVAGGHVPAVSGRRSCWSSRTQKYRAVTDRAAERRAVDESFAQSVHWGFKVEAEEGGKVLVDATAFFLRDAHGVAERLRQTKQGVVPARRRPQRPGGRPDEGLSQEHGSRGPLDLRRRRRDRPARRRDGPVAQGGDRPPAAFAGRVAGAEFGVHARGGPTPASASSPSTSMISPRPSPSRSSGSSSRGTA